VTARTNRQKADQDPAEWMPPHPAARCRYIAEWTATKLRRGLSADQAEADATKQPMACTGGTELALSAECNMHGRTVGLAGGAAKCAGRMG
jgi:hypothetical protein